MVAIIKWCNENNGFLTAILSIIGLLLSIIAIVVSIRTARLPYKKRIRLGTSLLLGASITPGISAKTVSMGLSASATNIGNRVVSLTYLGFAVKKDRRVYKIYPINRQFDSKATLSSSEIHEVQFQTEELLKAFSSENKAMKLFVYANDTEGKEYKRKFGTVGRLIESLSESDA